VQTTPAQRDLARRLLAREMGARRDPAALPEATGRACRKLCERLAKLVTAAGCRALVGRALHLASAESPFLEGVRAGSPPETCLEGLGERVQGVEPAAAEHGLAAILASLIGLLVTFIGEDLTLRLVRDVWPDVPPVEGDVGTTEATT
jgi:hypothetical protein